MNTENRGSPKDWAPWIRPTGNFMLPENQVERLREIRKKVLRGDPIGPDERADILWLCEKVRELARLKAEEYDFPRQLRWVNPVMMHGVKAKLAGRLRMRSEGTFRTDDLRGGVTIFEHTTHSRAEENILVVRPWLRVAPDCPPWLFEELKGSYIDFEMDGERLINRGDIADHLTGPDGFGLRRKPVSIVHSRYGCLFWASLWDDRPLPPYEYERGEVLAAARVGYFAPNGTRLELRVWNDRMSPGHDIRLTAGVVSALYRLEWS